MPMTRVACTLGMPSLSRTPETTTSTMLSSDVSPATVKEAKNNTPISDPKGAWEMIVGNATKASVMPCPATSETPWPVCPAMKPRAAKTPIPASSSKPELAKPTTSPEPVRSVRRFR